MKCIGLVGDIGLDSALLYQRRLEKAIISKYGHSYLDKIVILRYKREQSATTSESFDLPAQAAHTRDGVDRLIDSGSGAIVLCSSRLHIGAEQLDLNNNVLLHIADSTISSLRRSKVKRLGLLGTRYPEENLFWRSRFERANLPDIFLPTQKDQERVTHIIDDELHRGIVRMSSAAELVRVIYSLRQAGVQAVVLAVPALALSLEEAEPVLPLYDAAEQQITAAVDWACSSSERRRNPSKATIASRPTYPASLAVPEDARLLDRANYTQRFSKP
jgi:aspartate racemase